MLKKFFGIVIIFFIGICVLGIMKNYYPYKELKTSNDSVVTEGTFSGKTLKYSLNNMGFLVTAEYQYTCAEKYDTGNRTFIKIEIPDTNSKFIYTCDGSISAGIDFSKIDLKVKEETKDIIVYLPMVENKFSAIDHNSFKLYDEKKSVFNPISVEEVNNSFAYIEKREEENAIKKGLHKRAEENAKILIESFLKNSCGEDYDITFLELQEEIESKEKK